MPTHLLSLLILILARDLGLQLLAADPANHPNPLGLSTQKHKAKIQGNDSQSAAAFESAIDAMLAAQDPASPNAGCLNEAEIIDAVKKDKMAMRKVKGMKPAKHAKQSGGVKPAAAQPGDEDFIQGDGSPIQFDVNIMLRLTAFHLGFVTASSDLKELDQRVIDLKAAVNERQRAKTRIELDDKTNRQGTLYERINVAFHDPDLHVDVDALPVDILMAMVAHSDASGEYDPATMGNITSKEGRRLFDVQRKSFQAAVRRSEVTGECRPGSFVNYSSIRTAAAAHAGAMQPGDPILDIVGSKADYDLSDPINVHFPGRFSPF